MSAEVVLAHLDVDRTAMIDALKTFAKVTRFKDDAQAILSFVDGWLEFRIGGEDVSAPATGYWPGEARVTGALLRSLTRQPASGRTLDTIHFSVANGRLTVEGHSVPCAWQNVGASRIGIKTGVQREILTGATLREILVATMHASALAIEESGLTAKVAASRAKKRSLIEKAAAVLAPLGIAPDQLEQFVDASLMKNFTV